MHDWLVFGLRNKRYDDGDDDDDSDDDKGDNGGGDDDDNYCGSGEPANGRRFSLLIAAEGRFTKRNVCD